VLRTLSAEDVRGADDVRSRVLGPEAVGTTTP
jgi:hypothetical protein